MQLPNYPEAAKVQQIISKTHRLVIVQADNPDADSLASTLALEQILTSQGKEPLLYCGVSLPSYLSYIPGADRVVSDFPAKFDMTIIVDTSSLDLLEHLQKTGTKSWVASKPCIVIDHHQTKASIDFADIILAPKAVATGEVIYELARQLSWKLSIETNSLLASAILSDSLGLMSSDTSARSIEIIAEMVDSGISLPALENNRRETLKRQPELVHYKGRLLQRVEFVLDDRLALLTIPWEEIEKYSPLYNPSMLVIEDMRLAKGTQVVICFKLYDDGKITAKIRCNHGFPLADKLAEHFGGGGHPYAAGFKLQGPRVYEDIKTEVIKTTNQLLETFRVDEVI